MVDRISRPAKAGASVETQRPQAGAVGVRSSRPGAERDAGRIGHQRLRAEDIADPRTELRSADRAVYDLAQRGMVPLRRGQPFLRTRRQLRAAPGCVPLATIY